MTKGFRNTNFIKLIAISKKGYRSYPHRIPIENGATIKFVKCTGAYMGIAKNDDGFLTEAENLQENEKIELFFTLRKHRSGLPVNLFLDDAGSWVKYGHLKIIKFQPDKGDRPIPENMIPMSIDDNPQILIKDENIDLTNAEIEQIKYFVKANKDLLLQLNDQKIDFLAFINQMNIDIQEKYFSKNELP
jgi:hypothetical protein